MNSFFAESNHCDDPNIQESQQDVRQALSEVKSVLSERITPISLSAIK